MRKRQGWVTNDERLRMKVFNRELGRLALELGGARNQADDGWEARPHVLRFREDILGGHTLTVEEAAAFMSSKALAYLLPEHLNRAGISGAAAVGINVLRKEVKKARGILWEIVQFELTSGKRSTVKYGFPADRVTLRLPAAHGPDIERKVLGISVLGELQRLGSTLAEHYLWQESQACWFVLTGELPYPPSFTYTLEGGHRHDHEQYRALLSVPLWASEKTVVKMFRAARVQALGPSARPLRASRLRLVDLLAPLRYRGLSWRGIAKQRSVRSRCGNKQAPNLARDFVRTYRLLMWARLKS